MSRSGYSDDYLDCDNPELYRATVERTLKGKRGQSFLRELAADMDAMAVKELIAGELVTSDGAPCALGVVCKARSLDLSRVNYFNPGSVAHALGISQSMAAEIEFMNDEWRATEGPAERWTRMRKWVAEQITPSQGPPPVNATTVT